MRTLPNRQQIPHETIHQLLSCQTEKKVITKSITPPRSTIRAEHYCAPPEGGAEDRVQSAVRTGLRRTPTKPARGTSQTRARRVSRLFSSFRTPTAGQTPFDAELSPNYSF